MPDQTRKPRPFSLSYRSAAGSIHKTSSPDATADELRVAIKMLEVAAKGYEAEDAAEKAKG